MGALDGKAALITGGSRGIGLAIAKRFVAEGAHVVITGRDQHRLDRFYTTVADSPGHLDIVVAAAAIGSAVPFADVTPEQFDAGFDTDTRGVFFTAQKALPLFDAVAY